MNSTDRSVSRNMVGGWQNQCLFIASGHYILLPNFVFVSKQFLLRRILDWCLSQHSHKACSKDVYNISYDDSKLDDKSLGAAYK